MRSLVLWKSNLSLSLCLFHFSKYLLYFIAMRESVTLLYLDTAVFGWVGAAAEPDANVASDSLQLRCSFMVIPTL